jgi:hypothetical protein
MALGNLTVFGDGVEVHKLIMHKQGGMEYIFSGFMDFLYVTQIMNLLMFFDDSSS